MAKRTRTDSAVTNPRNFHPTPWSAAEPLARNLPQFTMFDEPCAGDGRLRDCLSMFGHHCVVAADIQPAGAGIIMANATTLPTERTVITNPPFEWALLEPLLDHWIGNVDTWLLLPWDAICNKRMAPYVQFMCEMLPLGRVSWMDNGKGGFENYGWFHFDTQVRGLVLQRC